MLLIIGYYNIVEISLRIQNRIPLNIKESKGIHKNNYKKTIL